MKLVLWEVNLVEKQFLSDSKRNYRKEVLIGCVKGEIRMFHFYLFFLNIQKQNLHYTPLEFRAFYWKYNGFCCMIIVLTSIECYILHWLRTWSNNTWSIRSNAFYTRLWLRTRSSPPISFYLHSYVYFQKVLLV